MSSARMLPSTTRASTRPPPRSAQVHVALDAVEVDVALDRRDALAAAQLPGDHAAPHVRDADAAAGRLQLRAGAQPGGRHVAAEGLGLDRDIGRHLDHQIDAAARERQRALAPAQLDARVDDDLAVLERRVVDAQPAQRLRRRRRASRRRCGSRPVGPTPRTVTRPSRLSMRTTSAPLRAGR